MSSFQQSEYQEGYVTEGVRTTRSKFTRYEEGRTTETVLTPVEENMEKTVLKTRFVTSDYSSDDGENEVSSTLQNYKNQTVENSNTKVNGELSALKVYRQAGEYWNKYPKTDYTYSHHSKDRVEISPGVIQMPNMSRKSLRNSPITSTSPNMQFIADKACSTDSYLDTSSFMHDYSTETILRPRNLFSTTPRQATSNNNTVNGDRNKQQYYTSSSSRYSRSQSTNVIVRIWQYLLTWTYFLYKVQSQSTLWAMKRFYRFSCWVLLMDRWLLTKTSQATSSSDSVNRRASKIKKLLALCLIPLLLGGWFLLWGLASLFSNQPVAVDKILVIEDMPPNHPNFKHQSSQLSASEIASALTQEQLLVISENIRHIINVNNIQHNDLPEKLLRDPNFINLLSARLKETTNFEIPPSVDTAIKDNYSEEELVDKLLQNPMFLNIIKNDHKAPAKDDIIEKTVQNQNILIKQLQEQMERLRLGLTADSYVNIRRLEHQLKRCCRNSLIPTEKYILDIIKNIFLAPSNLNQADFVNWLRTVFIARDDLESHLGNLTANLNDKYHAMTEESGRLLMDQVALKLQEQVLEGGVDYERITSQLRQELQHGRSTTNIAQYDDDYIKKIVKDVLAIYDADKTGLVDYALESSGAEVLSTKCTESYHYSTAVWTILGVNLWHVYKSPNTVLTPGVNPGECWAFQSFPGYMVIKLARRIHIQAISYEHVSKLLIPNGRIDSAPKKFAIYGIVDPDDNKSEPLLLGEFVYDTNGEPLQFFPVHYADVGEMLMFGFIEMRVNTNHGNPNYTCLYRLRVHGIPALEQPT